MFDALADEFLWKVAGCCFGEFCLVFAFVCFLSHVLLHFCEEGLWNQRVFAAGDFVGAVLWVEEGFVEEVVFVPWCAEEDCCALCGAEHWVDYFGDYSFGDEAGFVADG